MCLEVKRSFGSRNGKQRRRPALYLRSVGAGGKVLRKYVGCRTPGCSAILEAMANCGPLPTGRPAAYPDEVRAVINSCGFNLHGVRLTMGRGYFQTASAESRFGLLSDDDKIRVGSAETLLSLEKQAYSLLKLANVKRIPRRYSDCLREVMLKAQSVTSAKARRADTPPAPA